MWEVKKNFKISIHVTLDPAIEQLQWVLETMVVKYELIL